MKYYHMVGKGASGTIRSWTVPIAPDFTALLYKGGDTPLTGIYVSSETDSYVGPAQDAYTLHRWSLNDSGTSFLDIGTAGTHLSTITAGCTKSNVGFYSDYATFDGTSYAYSANNVNPTSAASISLSLWARVNAFSNYPRLIAKAYNATWTSPFSSLELLLNSGTGQLFSQWCATGGVYKNSAIPTGGPQVLLLKDWTHIGATFANTGAQTVVKFYINGALASTEPKASDPFDWNVGVSGPWGVGGTLIAAVNNFNGSLFDVRVDDGIVRSASYFNSMYKVGKGIIY